MKNSGFPSPAEDYAEGPLDLNAYLVAHPSATFFMRAEGLSSDDLPIESGDLLLVDRAVEPSAGDIVIALACGELGVVRLPRGSQRQVAEPPVRDLLAETEVWGVCTYLIRRLDGDGE